MKRASLPKHVPAETLKPLEIADGVYDLTPVVLDNLAHLGIECLIAIGGDDTLSFAKTLDSKGMRVIGIPKTMDNDVRGTEYCIGFSTAITRAKDADHAPAHLARLARAHRHLPHFRPRRRLHRAVHRLRDREPLRDSGSRVRSRSRHRTAGRGQAQ